MLKHLLWHLFATAIGRRRDAPRYDRSRYPLVVSRPTRPRNRRLQALVLAAVAIGLVIVEPFPEGAVLVSLTPTHGLAVGDLPAVALLLVAACLAI